MLLVSVLTLFMLMTSFVSPVLAQDRIFLNVSLDFLGESQLPQQNLGTQVGELSAITYDRQRDRLYAICNDSNEFAPVQFCTLKLTFDPTKVGIQIDLETVTPTNKDGQTDTKGTTRPGGIAVTPQKTLFISSSNVTGESVIPAVQEFDLKSGKLLTSLPMPKRYLPDATDEGIRTRGIQNNLGFASLTLNPTGTIPASGEPIRLFTATESALVQDKSPGEAKGTKSRLLHYLIGYGPPVLIAEHLYLLDPTPSDATSNGLVELLTLDQGGHFLSLERSESESGFNAKIFQMTTGGATDTSRIDSLKGSIDGIQPVKKKLLLDLKKLDVSLSNLQGMTFGPRLPDGTRSLLLVGNNLDRLSQFLLFRLK